MQFNSIEYLIFFPIVFICYWIINNRNLLFQNSLLLFSSYFFYACWDWRFLILLIFSTILDYFVGNKIQNNQAKNIKRFWLWFSIFINIGFLAIFKYFNFFSESFSNLLSFFGLKSSLFTLKIILPVGISFYTFHGLSYIIDIYNNKIRAEKNVINYAVFVSFFPLLVAGPIERATHLLPQIKQKRKFEYATAVDGLRQILWGLLKKIVIADNCAEIVNQIFNHSYEYSGSTLVFGAILFAFQIYGDFSGYSDIALGSARLFGIELLQNFSFPYFSRNIAEFWRRWHISLSSWFRDYIYIPLGGSKNGLLKQTRNLFIIFILSGFWHGANWTFIVWGFLHALYMLPLIYSRKNRSHLEIVANGKIFPSLKESIQILTTFSLTVFAWIFFRAENLIHAKSILFTIFSKSIFTIPTFRPYLLLFIIFIFIAVEWIGRNQKYALEGISKIKSKGIRWLIYVIILLVIFYFGYHGDKTEFIYFQF